MKRYNNYKHSGVEWLGEIPEHWEFALMTKNLFSIVDYRGKTPRKLEDNENGMFLVTARNIKGGVINYSLSEEYVDFEEAKKLLLRGSLKVGDVLFTTEAPLGEVANIDRTDIALAQRIIKFSGITTKLNNYYLKYWLSSNSFQSVLRTYATGSTVEGIKGSKLRLLNILLPELAEQTAIAKYLDNKTAAIDRKTALLTTKVEKYKALSRSLINETVCRGIHNESFTQSETLTRYKLKDSGIEWIGKIPEHWEVKRVKEVFDISRGRVIGQQELIDDGMYPVYSSQTENDGCLGYINTYDYNATLLTWTTDGANAGTVFKRTGKSNCTNVCGILKPKKQDFNLDYILYVLQVSASHNKRIDTNGAKIMSNEMSVIPLIYPPICEQTAIANYLDEQTTQIDTILSNISQQISKLTQFRKILINEVVTGKIKVVED